MVKKGSYKHNGGGCVIGGGHKYPCDDHYESKDKIIDVISTKNAHFSMPDRVSGPSQLRRKKGVKSVRVFNKRV